MRPRSYLYEVPVFTLLLWGVQRGLFPDLLSFVKLDPNPCWLGILLFALRYGLAAGVYAGLFSVGLYALAFRLGGESYRFEDADFYLLPGLFLVAGAAIGGVTDRFQHRITSLDVLIEDLKEQVKGLLKQLQAQRKAQRAIEQQVVSQMSSVVTLYHGSRDLGHLERPALLAGVLDFFTRALQATKTSLYVPEVGRWVLKDQRGWTEADTYPRSLDHTEGLAGRAGSERRVVSLRDWFGPGMEDAQAQANADSIMAGPLLDSAGEVAAVFAVQAMPLLKFNTASVNLLTLLLDWGSEALAKCDRFQELRSKSILDEEFGVYNRQYFESRARQEFSRSKAYALPLSVLLVGPGGPDGAPIERRLAFLHALARLLKESVRDIDIVAKTPFEEAPFAVLMTGTQKQAERLREKVLEGYAKLGLPRPLRVGIGSFHQDMPSQEALLEQARHELG